MAYSNHYDVEKQPGLIGAGAESPRGSLKKNRNTSLVESDGAVPGESFEYGTGFYAKCMRLAGKLKMEQRGIERVPEDERTDAGFKALLNVSTMV